MDFEWDDEKAATNLRKHGISFDEAKLVFSDRFHVSTVDRDIRHEERHRTIGLVAKIGLIIVVHTVEETGDDVLIRIISARRTQPFERRQYQNG